MNDTMTRAAGWLQDTLDYTFRDDGLLEQALTHRSAAGHSNERLEFLGDAVLDLVVSEHVFRAAPGSNEGDLSRLRASLVKDRSLADIASDLGIGEHLILGSGERKTGGHRRESILADAVEALFGAIYLDAGFAAARDAIVAALGHRLDNLPDPRELRDPKTRLQEWLQSRGRALPEYEMVNVSGKAHRQVFDVECRVDGDGSGARGTGSSRRAAEQQAARTMLARLRGQFGE